MKIANIQSPLSIQLNTDESSTVHHFCCVFKGNFVTEIADIDDEFGDFVIKIGDMNIQFGDFSIQIGEFIIEIGDLNYEIGDFTVKPNDSGLQGNHLPRRTDRFTIMDCIPVPADYL